MPIPPVITDSKSLEVSVAPQPSIDTKTPEIAYVVKDKSFELSVLKSANAWWMAPEKVRDLIACFKNGFEVQDALSYAGITRGQWEYFTKMHPGFSAVREACDNIAFQLAEKSNIEGLKIGDLPHTRWFLNTRRPDKYPKNDAITPPAGNNNFGTIINNNIDVSKVKPSVLKAVLDKRNNGTTAA